MPKSRYYIKVADKDFQLKSHRMCKQMELTWLSWKTSLFTDSYKWTSEYLPNTLMSHSWSCFYLKVSIIGTVTSTLTLLMLYSCNNINKIICKHHPRSSLANWNISRLHILSISFIYSPWATLPRLEFYVINWLK